eukprot:g1734.t1
MPIRVLCCMQGEKLKENKGECEKCRPGHYQGNDYTQTKSCYRCPRDTVSLLHGASNCSVCSRGRFSNDGEKCLSCISGKKQVDAATSSYCLNCTIGRYQPGEGMHTCLGCNKGQYQDQEAKQFCLPACPAGRYQPGAGKTGCINISVGYEGIGGNTSLENPGHMAEAQCPAGRYSGNFTCLACRADTFTSSPGKASCKDCRPGKHTGGRNSSTLCGVCNAGEEVTGELGSRECAKCIPGKISTPGGNCTNCAAGSYANPKSTECLECKPGTFGAHDGSHVCRLCPAGRYQPGAGKTGCVDIAAGYEGIGGSTNVSHPGHMAMVPCPAGKYSSAFACADCPADRFTSAPGETSCKECGDGTLTRGENGSAACKVCPGGRQASGQPGSRECAPCEKGTWSSTVGANGSSACRKCPAGTYSSAKGVADPSGCNPCSAGRFSSVDGATGACTQCPGGFFQNETAATTCARTPSGNIIIGKCVHQPELGVYPKDCTSEQFLNGYTGNRTAWECEACLEGAESVPPPPACSVASKTAAELFYGKQAMYTFVPAITGFVGGFCSGLATAACPPKDKFIVTVTAIVFLMYPTMCEKAFAMFSCKTIGGRQSQVALLLLLVCIILEIVGQPFKEVTESHGVLKRLEIAALLVEYGTLWCGLMIFQSGPKSEAMNVFMTVCVVAANVGLTLCFAAVLFRDCARQAKVSRIVQRMRNARRRTFEAMARGGVNTDNPTFEMVGGEAEVSPAVVEMVGVVENSH